MKSGTIFVDLSRWRFVDRDHGSFLNNPNPDGLDGAYAMQISADAGKPKVDGFLDECRRGFLDELKTALMVSNDELYEPNFNIVVVAVRTADNVERTPLLELKWQAITPELAEEFQSTIDFTLNQVGAAIYNQSGAISYTGHYPIASGDQLANPARRSAVKPCQ